MISVSNHRCTVFGTYQMFPLVVGGGSGGGIQGWWYW